VLDQRVYRAAFLPALVAIALAAFSLADRPAPSTSRLAPIAFDATRAFGSSRGAPARDTLRELAASYPRRQPGSAGDMSLAGRVARIFAVNGFDVRRSTRTGRTADGKVDLETVVGVRAGLSSRRIVILAHRDALGSPAVAELSGTAALLELARVFKTRDLTKTLVLVSTSGGSAGDAGARELVESEGGEVDGVLVLGDLASAEVRKPWVVPWSNDGRPAPLGLQRTVEAAIRQEVGAAPGGARAASQWARRAVPVTTSEQGQLLSAGLPAVLLQISGELGPAADAPVRRSHFQELGRAALRAVTAMDAGSARTLARGPDGVVTLRNVLPAWAVRMLVGALLLPALLVAVDAFFRARRRRLRMRRWVAWCLVGAVPFVLAWAWLRVLELIGGVKAPLAPVVPSAVPVDGAAVAVFLSSLLVVALGWYGLRPVLLRWVVGGTGHPAAGGAAGAAGVVLCGLVGLVWLFNPYAALLLVPAAHLWLMAAAPGGRLNGWAAAAVVAAGLLLPALVVLYYSLALDLDPFELGWVAMLATAGGHVSLWTVLALSVLAGCLAAVVTILRARRHVERLEEPEPMVTRGPASYAGPGSLGGTESALRR
jgi:hypothetical protein